MSPSHGVNVTEFELSAASHMMGSEHGVGGPEASYLEAMTPNPSGMRAMPIIRSRTGCFTCRKRKKKCDESSSTSSASRPSRPSFGAASSSSQQSISSSSTHRRPVLASHDTDSAVDPAVPEAESETDQVVTEIPGLPQNDRDTRMADVDGEADGVFEAEAEAGIDHDHVQPSPSSSSDSSSTVVTNYDQDTANALSLAVQPASEAALPLNEALTMSLPMSMLPEQGHQSYELLSYYLSRTANSMGNGSTDVNPFIAKLIPLAFSKPLVLQLILAQSAAHRQASAERHPSDEIAQRYYTDSLRMFRNVVDEYVSGNAENTLVLTVGSLIMCLTEVAKGDVLGTIFDHLTAAKSLVSTLLTSSQNQAYDDLPDFLIEYYMHIAATSMISMDPQYNSQSLLSPDIEVRARNLVARKYGGQLCGCWLELLILISQIFHLGQNMSSTADGQVTPTPDNIVNFAFLQSQVMGFFPDASVSPYSRLAGLVWKQAALLYLWTVLGRPHQQPEGSIQRALVESTVAEAVTLLDQFPATVRINTSLCWPLAVIGCSTSDAAVQQVLRTRLQTMLDTIGLGNMRQTLVLLEYVWQKPPEQVSPWTLCRAMRERQIWISFA
ncbi:hypothetical protein F66182_5918 [Fusarium sp. NRRL 66182]|nr:hypothetical protein F66182_5918 [Fusarium sp. NRRL 66182]